MIVFAVLAQITNKALPGALQNAASPGAAGAGLAKYIGILWQTALVAGGLAVVAYMITGGLSWITAGGEKGKIEAAKERITQGLLGLAVLFSVAAISTFFGKALGIDLLAPNFASISGGGGGTVDGGSSTAGGGAGEQSCPGGVALNTTVGDGGAGQYCTKKANGEYGSAQVKCVGSGSGPSHLPYPHYEPCSCESGTTLLSGYSTEGCN